MLFGNFSSEIQYFGHLELQGEQTAEEMKATFLASFSGDSDFPCVFFSHLIRGKNMRPKIELDSWKEWVRNSALQISDDDFLDIWSSNSSRHDLQNKGRTDV